MFSSVVSGSRAGPLIILIIFFSCSLVLKENFRYKIRDYLLFFTLLFDTSLISFQWGTEARNALLRAHNPTQILAQAMAEEQEHHELQKEKFASSSGTKTSLSLSMNLWKKFLTRFFSPFDKAIMV
jgi:hypothetical protein